jgi:hypothetical protein
VENSPEQQVDQQSSLQQQSATPVSKPKSKLKILLLIFILSILAGGVYFLTLNKNKLLSQYSQKSIPTSVPKRPTPTPDPTANWKTYRNEQYNFEFKYPATLNYNSKQNSGVVEELIFSNGMSVLISNNQLIAQEAKVSEMWNGENIHFPQSCKTNGCHFYTFSPFVGSWSKNVDFSKENARVELSQRFDIKNNSMEQLDDNKFDALMSSGQIDSANLMVFSQILSTFKFTDQNRPIDTSNWTIYRGKDFAIKYPANWISKAEKNGETNFYNPKKMENITMNGGGILSLSTEYLNVVWVEHSTQTAEQVAKTFQKAWLTQKIKIETKTVNGLDYALFTDAGEGSRFNNLAISNGKVIIHLNTSMKALNGNDIENQILSTFRFTN